MPRTKVASRSAATMPEDARSGGNRTSRPSPIGSHSRLRSRICATVKTTAATFASRSLRQAITRWAR